jgi:hypothetical protein
MTVPEQLEMDVGEAEQHQPGKMLILHWLGR